MNVIRLPHANAAAVPLPAKSAGIRTLSPYLTRTTAGQVPAIVANSNLLPVGKQIRKRNGFA